MAIEIKLPELGDGIESGDVLDVLVHEGDVIAKDQAVCELETDKATVEVPSSHAGKVVRIHISSGQSVPIGATLLTLESVESAAPQASAPEEPSASAAEPPAAAEATAEATPAEATPAEAARESPAPAEATTPPTAAPAPAARPAPAATPAPVTPAAETPTIAAGSSAAAGPAIRRLAREVGIDLAQITGTGTGGRITRDDVLAAVRRSSAVPAPRLPPRPPTTIRRLPAARPRKPPRPPPPLRTSGDQSRSSG